MKNIWLQGGPFLELSFVLENSNSEDPVGTIGVERCCLDLFNTPKDDTYPSKAYQLHNLDVNEQSSKYYYSVIAKKGSCSNMIR